MTIQNFLQHLNDEQKKAALAAENTVVAAGAGSGKTRVLSARFVHLVVERGIPIDKILALTFTNKAAAEMNHRIYTDLKRIDCENAKKALQNFRFAKIMTLDSFCTEITRAGCRSYGIAPDFSVDQVGSQNLAKETALSFFLKHRNNPSLLKFMGTASIDHFISQLLEKLLLFYTAVSSPVNLFTCKKNQEKEKARLFTSVIESLKDNLETCKLADPSAKGVFITRVVNAVTILPDIPQKIKDINTAFLNFLHDLNNIPLPGGKPSAQLLPIKQAIKNIKDVVYPAFVGFYIDAAYQKETDTVLTLLSGLQEEFIQKKKTNGIFSHTDIAELARDILIQNLSVRLMYKNLIDAVMIDEFQDNNSLQRDILFLIAEEERRNKRTVPQANELIPNKLFFVGDEKQSIYAFRGADVSVFRKLSSEMNGSSKPSLNINYRSESVLIDSFNSIFSSPIFTSYEKNRPLYEAEFLPIQSAIKTSGILAGVDVVFFNNHRLKDSENNLFFSPEETEAAELSMRIREMYESGFTVRDKEAHEGIRKCRWQDFAILFSETKHQHVFERFLRNASIPFVTLQQKGMFYDAPANDLYALLRLCIYPENKRSYAQVLRTPFVKLDDNAFTAVMLDFLETREVFSKRAETLLDEKNAQAFIHGRRLFERVQRYTHTLSNAEIITALWYDEGYRYILLYHRENERFLELYDYLFEMARQADEDGLSIQEFVDKLYGYIFDGEKIDEMEIPVNRPDDAVQIMTIHKSKGLEFPIVFVPECGRKFRSLAEDAYFFYTNPLGVVLNSSKRYLQDVKIKEKGMRWADGLQNASNPLFEDLRDEENAKIVAEKKRLLYVAVTRAECRLIISGVEKSSALKSYSNFPEDLDAIKLKMTDKPNSFFQLLIPSLSNDTPVCFTEVLPVPQKIYGQKINTIKKAPPSSVLADCENTFTHAAEKTYTAPQRRIMPVTEFLRINDDGLKENRMYTEKANRQENFDTLLPTELGSLAHAVLEAAFLKKRVYIPAKYAEQIERMKQNFLTSPLGKKACAASFIRTEYDFVTHYNNRILIGQADLLFSDDEKTLYIVDYKTDKTEDPSIHAPQLQIYKKAIQDLFPQYASYYAVLFYLRSGNMQEIV